jgi:hypothetical protein
MDKQNILNNLEKEVDQKYKKKEKKKKCVMKVSGAKVKQLQKIIKK